MEADLTHIAKEGATVRKHWFAAWAIVGLSAGDAGLAAQPSGAADVGQSAGWTTWLTAPFNAGETPRPPQPSLPAPPPVPPTPELYVGMAEMSHRGGDVDQARRLYQQALALNPNDLEALLGAARMEDRLGRLELAAYLYDRTARAHPRNPTVLNDLALCLARQGDLPAAHAALQQAVQFDPRKPLYRNNVAKVLIEMNRPEEALAHLSAVHSPAVANYNMGVLLAERGRPGEAAHYLTTATGIDPQMAPAHLLLAQVNPPLAAANNAAERSIVQTARVVVPTAMPKVNDSILPTPETQPGEIVRPVDGPSTPWPAAATAVQPAGDEPVLLPPVH